jgi:hypothetical protein
LNFNRVDIDSIFLALVDKVGSDGSGAEIEHPFNCGSRVFLTTRPGEELGWVMKEYVAMGRAEYIPYKKTIELANELNRRIEA